MPSADPASSAAAPPPTVGFVGLGHMGGPMAARVASGYPLIAYDVDPSAGDGLTGVRRARNLGEVARTSDLVLLSLPAGPESWSVIEQLTAVPDSRARTVVELSTVGPTWAQRCSDRAGEAGWRYVDAPVSGGRRNAINGTLSIMLAGPAEDVTAVLPVVKLLSGAQFVIGERAGLGQAMKLTNNAIALAVLPVTSEALHFGARFGLDLTTMLEVINASSGRTQRSEVMFPTSILTRRFDHGALGEIVHKDMSLYVEEAARVGVPARIGALITEFYAAFVDAHPRTDYSYLHEFLGTHAGPMK